MIISPCKDCTERNMKCHGKCERYKNWKHEHEEAREKLRNKNQYSDSYGGWIKTSQGYWRNNKIKRRK